MNNLTYKKAAVLLALVAAVTLALSFTVFSQMFDNSHSSSLPIADPAPIHGDQIETIGTVVSSRLIAHEYEYEKRRHQIRTSRDDREKFVEVDYDVAAIYHYDVRGKRYVSDEKLCNPLTLEKPEAQWLLNYMRSGREIPIRYNASNPTISSIAYTTDFRWILWSIAAAFAGSGIVLLLIALRKTRAR